MDQRFDAGESGGAQGGFGCLAAGTMPGEALAEEIRNCREGSDAPFAVNLV
jgi:NAD(P)H-dependent flavin oxidoreductase YrpB (nitropropane dioxygenase family)